MASLEVSNFRGWCHHDGVDMDWTPWCKGCAKMKASKEPDPWEFRRVGVHRFKDGQWTRMTYEGDESIGERCPAPCCRPAQMRLVK